MPSNILSDSQCIKLLEVLWRDSITGLVLVDKRGRFVAANPQFCKMTEYTEVELKSMTFADITDPADIDADSQMAKAVANGEIPGYDMTKRYIIKTRRFLLILLRVSSLQMNGQFIYFVSQALPIDGKMDTSEVDKAISSRWWATDIKAKWWVVALAIAATAEFLRELLGLGHGR